VCCDKYKALFDKGDECYDSNTSATEKGKTYRIEIKDKSERFCRIKIDGCVIPEESKKKCDYLFVRCKTEDLYFIELKGKHGLDEAYNQIEQTILYFASKIQNNNKFGRIVGATVPSGTKGQNLSKKYKNKFRKHGQLIIHSGSIFTENKFL